MTPIWRFSGEKREMMKNFGHDAMEKAYERRILLKLG
jgi:hypothetical protein